MSVFKLAALSLLAVFGTVYFLKMRSMKRLGIDADCLAKRGKSKHIIRTERLLCLASYLIIPIQLISIIFELSQLPIALRITGIFAAFIGDIIFYISVRDMGLSFRAGIPNQAQDRLITSGIYRISRNPCFLGFDFMYIGILFMFFNPVLLAFTVWTAIMLHLQILCEERFLQTVFGEEYLLYKAEVCRYFGRH